ncbi:hypothetical protein KW486_17125 [Vibrio fluvialis]|nr:hypothetical protein [Vibrio fluvialis]MBY8052208.1 hypothetical protein [Vibrio fluvialis]
MKKFYIVTNYNNHLPQYSHETDSLDLNKLSSSLSIEFDVIIKTLDQWANELCDNSLCFIGDYFFFASSQIPEYKSAILDIAYETQRRGGLLVPSFDFYLAHENKYYQELHKNRIGITTPRCKLLTTSNSNVNFSNSKYVVKPSFGFGSRGISLQDNSERVLSASRSLMTSYILSGKGVYNKIKCFIKSIKFRGLYPRKFGKVVAQEYIPDLQHDWKVLVFNNKAFALKRFVRKNDFRASGSGDFDFSQVASDELIKFAFSVKNKFNVPFVSLDIAESNNLLSIIEYQAVHFGLVTCYKSKHHYIINDGIVELVKDDAKNEVESIFSEAIIEYVKGV